ncbi:MAG: EamA family transporter [Bacteriovorax sp.]|nr:EamA family transporter [Bacteriovorax sp.]
MTSIHERKIGFIQIILSGVCFSFLGFFGKMAYKRHITPGELLSLRYFLSAILTGLLILLTKPKSLFTLSRFEIICSLLLGIFGYALFSSFYFMALTGLSASLTVLLLYTYPVMVTIFSRIFLKEKMGEKGFVALVLVMIGLVALVWGEWSVSKPIYLLFGIGSAVFYAFYIILSRKYLKHVAVLPSSFYVQLGAGGVLSLINFSGNRQRPLEIMINHYPLILSMSVLCSLMAMTLFLAGLQKITSSEASILSTTEPIFGVIIATTLLGENIQPIQVIGGVLILIGMIIIATKKNPNS